MTKVTTFSVLVLATVLVIVAAAISMRPVTAAASGLDTGRYVFERIGDDTIYMFDKERGVLRIWKRTPGRLVTTYRFDDPEEVRQEDFKFRSGI